MFECQWCNERFNDINRIDHTADGFWCDICNGFTYIDPSRKQTQFLLLLEEKSSSKSPIVISPDAPKLRKRLSPLRYPGGKSKIVDYLYSKLSAEKLDTFVEVFAGGASLGLSLLDAGCINQLVLNDKDPNVFAFWETVLDCPEELTGRLASEVPTHHDLIYAKNVLSLRNAPAPELAWSFLLVNRLSYSGIAKANPMGGKNGTQESLLTRWNPNNLIKRILHIHSMRNQIKIYNMDYADFLEQTGYWHGGTLFVDPPYFVQGPKLYPCYFEREDHERLAELLQAFYMEFPEPDIIITYDNHPYIRQLYSLAEQELIYRRYSA